MANSKVSNYSVGDSSIDDVMLTLDQNNKGYIKLTLTEVNTTSIPLIEQGSVVEVDGALFKFTSNETPSGSPSDGTVYIKLVPDGGGTFVTAEYTNTMPTWNDDKQGWYTPATSERYVAKFDKDTASYINKEIMTGRNSSGQIMMQLLSSDGTQTNPILYQCTFNSVSNDEIGDAAELKADNQTVQINAPGYYHIYWGFSSYYNGTPSAGGIFQAYARIAVSNSYEGGAYNIDGGDAHETIATAVYRSSSCNPSVSTVLYLSTNNELTFYCTARSTATGLTAYGLSGNDKVIITKIG
jgi:hypothetical protein